MPASCFQHAGHERCVGGRDMLCIHIRATPLTPVAQTTGTVCLSIAAGVDVLIAIVMTFLLVRSRVASGSAR